MDVQMLFNWYQTELFHMVPDIFHVHSLCKSDEASEEARKIGNDSFKQEDWFSSLLNYNTSITFAESKDVVSLGYANRSAVYLKIKRYEDCLNNIQWALENDYPQDKLPKLIEREAKCKELMKESLDVEPENLWDFFKLSYPANEKIPWIVDRVEMRWTEKYGRGIYAKEDLKAGDIISIEEPAVNYADEFNVYLRCYNCFKTNALNLLPCDKTASKMFCSIECKENFYSKAVDMTYMLCADVKMLSDIVEVYGTVENFEKFIERTDLKCLNKTVFDFDFSKPEDTEYKRNMITCLLSLSTNGRKVIRDNVSRHILSEKATQHIMSIYNLNFMKVHVNNGDSKVFNAGYCIPLFASLINYSCIRNASPLMVDNKLVTVIQRPIKAGEQIFFYYPSDLAMFSPFAKNILEMTHEFKCDCELCANNIERDIDDYKALLEPFKNVSNPAYDRQYDEVKEYLNRAWNGLNNKPATIKGLSPHTFQTIDILETIAYQCAYPFFNDEPVLF